MEHGYDNAELSDAEERPRRLLGWCLWVPAFGFAGFLWIVLACVCIYGFSAARFSAPTIASPDGAYEVEVSSDNCGATCPYHTTVALREREDSWLGDLLNTGDATTIHSSKNSPCDISPVWRDSRTLEIGVYSSSPDFVHSQKSAWRDVSIKFGSLTDKHRMQLDAIDCDSRWTYPSVRGRILVALAASIAMPFLGAGLVHLILRRYERLRW